MKLSIQYWTVVAVLAVVHLSGRAQAAVPLAEALDASSFVWTTGGAVPWAGQSVISQDGIDAAVSGPIASGEMSTMQTVVAGPGTVSFWWKVSSEADGDALDFAISSSEQARISGEVNWQQRTFAVPAGSHVLRWRYEKNFVGFAGQDRAWVDQVQYIPAGACSYAISPTNTLLNAGSATGLVMVATTSECAWIVENTNGWLSISSGASGTGNGLVRYVAVANPSPAARTGNLLIGGQAHTVTQAGTSCAFSISPTSRTHGPANESAIVNVLTVSGCPWIVVNTNAWISILSPTNGTGSSSLTYAVAANPSAQDRSGNVQVAGQLFTITQLANDGPAIATQPASQTVSVGATVSFSVTTAGVTPPVSYQWRFNGLDLSNGALVQGATTATLTLTSVQHAQAGAYSVVVTHAGGTLVSSDALLTVTTGAPSLAEALDVVGSPITLSTVGTPAWTGQTDTTHDGADAAASGVMAHSTATTIQAVVTGPGTVSFWWKVSSQTNSDNLKFFINGVEQTRISGEVNWESRSASLPAGTQTLKWTYSKNASLSAGLDRGWVDQVQFGSTTEGCTFAVSPVSATHPQASSTGFVSVATASGCAWNVFNTNAWITITSGAGGTDSGTVVYFVAANPGGGARSGNLFIAGQLVTVTQAGMPCGFTIAPISRNHGPGQEDDAVMVTTQNGCAWAVVNTNAWVTLLSSANNNSSGTVAYRVLANLNPSPRSGFITIAGEAFSISQSGGSLPPPVQIGNIEVPTLGHQFRDFSRIIPGIPNAVVDSLIDQDGSTGGGAPLPNLSVNWDTNRQFTMTVSAPPGKKFMVRLPPGRQAGFGGFMMWESTRGGNSGAGTLDVSFTGLEGPTPDFSGATVVLSHSHGYFGYSDLEGNTFSNDLAFISITLTATIIPQYTGNGTENYIPHQESRMEIIYRTPETNDPGRFVFLVPEDEPLVAAPTINAVLQPNGDVTITFTGTLQHAGEVTGPFVDVPGNPQGTYTIPSATLNAPRYFRAQR